MFVSPRTGTPARSTTQSSPFTSIRATSPSAPTPAGNCAENRIHAQSNNRPAHGSPVVTSARSPLSRSANPTGSAVSQRVIASGATASNCAACTRSTSASIIGNTS